MTEAPTDATARTATIRRQTLETEVQVDLRLDGTGLATVNTGIGFLDHMLAQLVYHAHFDATIRASGDIETDDHHTCEDVGIAFGQALRDALGDHRGIERFSSVSLPMDDALTQIALDISGRPLLRWHVEFPREKIGRFDTELVREWTQAFVSQANLTLHVDRVRGLNAHHIAESFYKGLGRALRKAVRVDSAVRARLPTTKGHLEGAV